jgi:hypothetical protein
MAMVCAPAALAKGETVKIVIEGGDLKAPIVITDPTVLAKFSIWSGPMTSTNDDTGFIVDWRKGLLQPKGNATSPPAELPRYQVSFYAKLSTVRLAYVVFYEYVPATQRGYVYVAGPDEPSYSLNVATAYHGVEGHWFRTWSGWETVARPLMRNSQAVAQAARN